VFARGSPPRELIDARAAYARASAGPAAQQAPARLRLARQALDAAEISYGAATENEVRDRAYIAIRRAESAEAEARAVLAIKRRTQALNELASIESADARRARGELAGVQQMAENEAGRAQAAEGRAAAEQGRAQAAEGRAATEQGRADVAESQLERERRARAAAEARADEAMRELGRVASVHREARGMVVTLSARCCSPRARPRCCPPRAPAWDSVAAALKALPPGTGKVTIEGHTDTQGPRDFNVELSQRRASRSATT
jgi:hypothetical protein